MHPNDGHNDHAGHDGDDDHYDLDGRAGQDGYDGKTNIHQTGSPCILCSLQLKRFPKLN